MKFKKTYFLLLLFFLTSCTDGMKNFNSLKSIFNKEGTGKFYNSSEKESVGNSEGSASEVFEDDLNNNMTNEIAQSAEGEANDSIGIIPEKSVAEIESINIQAALSVDSKYKIEESEIDNLKKEGIISESDITELNAIK